MRRGRGVPTKSGRCCFHQYGKPPEVASNAFFDANCRDCQRKLSDGIVTGAEPLPTDVNVDKPRQYTERLRKQHEARRKYNREMNTW